MYFHSHQKSHLPWLRSFQVAKFVPFWMLNTTYISDSSSVTWFYSPNDRVVGGWLNLLCVRWNISEHFDAQWSWERKSCWGLLSSLHFLCCPLLLWTGLECSRQPQPQREQKWAWLHTWLIPPSLSKRLPQLCQNKSGVWLPDTLVHLWEESFLLSEKEAFFNLIISEHVFRGERKGSVSLDLIFK